jgi:hypothetical protein
MNPASWQAATYRGYLNTLQQTVAVLREEQSAATSGNVLSFRALDGKYSGLNKSADSLSSQLGLSTCAGNGLSGSDKSDISHLISSTAVKNSPSQCTQKFTLAFVRQNWGTMAACIRNGKKRVGPHNPRSVDVSNIKGAGTLATADVVFHFASGRRDNLSVAVYHQNGSWRLLGFSKR